MSSNPDPLTQLIRTGRAATYTLIAVLGLCYVLGWATKSPIFTDAMAFSGRWTQPWTALTFPFASRGDTNGLVGGLFLLFWLYSLGGQIERDLGSARMIGLFLIAGLVGALFVDLAWQVTPTPRPVLEGSIIPIGALTAAWGVRNAKAEMRFWGVISVSGMWLAIIFAAFIPFVVSNGTPLAGVFALAPVGMAALYTANRLPGIPFDKSPSKQSRVLKATERRDKAYYDDVFRRTKEREEQDRLRKLFESSLEDDK